MSDGVYTHTKKTFLLYGELLGRPRRCGGPTKCVCRADSLQAEQWWHRKPQAQPMESNSDNGKDVVRRGTLIIKHSHFYMGRWQKLSLPPLCPQSELVWWDQRQSQSLLHFLACLILPPVLSSCSRTPCAKYIIACSDCSSRFQRTACNAIAVKNPSTKASMPTPLMNRSLLPTLQWALEKQFYNKLLFCLQYKIHTSFFSARFFRDQPSYLYGRVPGVRAQSSAQRQLMFCP